MVWYGVVCGTGVSYVVLVVEGCKSKSVQRLQILLSQPCFNLWVNNIAHGTGEGFQHAPLFIVINEGSRDSFVGLKSCAYRFWFVVVPLNEWLSRHIVQPFDLGRAVRIRINASRRRVNPAVVSIDWDWDSDCGQDCK